MKLLLVAAAGLMLPCFGQVPLSRPGVTPDLITKILSFENEAAGGMPFGWMGGPPGTIAVDKTIAHSGTSSARLERTGESAQSFSTITNMMPITFEGSRIELRGYLRTEDVAGFSGLWMREDGDQPALAFGQHAAARSEGHHRLDRVLD